MKKIRYELDPLNRFILEEKNKKTKLAKFRRVLDGKFKVGRNNTLIYSAKTPLPDDNYIPNQIKLEGAWSLTKNHDLRLAFDKERRETFGDSVTLKGNIMDVKKNSLLFSVTTVSGENVKSAYILELEGMWHADKNNRINFLVKKENKRYDTLTFHGAWTVNRNYEIIYKYEKRDLIRKVKKIHELIFKGYWDISEKMRIAYILEKRSDSIFNFKAEFGEFRENYIKYKLGIGAIFGGKKEAREIIFYGSWRIDKRLGLMFESESIDKKLGSLTFGAEAKLTENDTIIFQIKDDRSNKDLGVELELSHKLIKGDGTAFIRLLKSQKESAIFIGAGFNW